MIEKMIKYTFLLYHKEYGAFLDNLSELGLVDVSVSVSEPTEIERNLLTAINNYRLTGIALKPYHQAESDLISYDTAAEVMENFTNAQILKEQLKAQTAKVEKEIEEVKPWGQFSADTLDALSRSGLTIRYFIASEKDFSKHIDQWGGQYTIEQVAEFQGNAYFVVVEQPGDAPAAIDAQELKPLASDYAKKERELAMLHSDMAAVEKDLERCGAGYPLIIREQEELKKALYYEQVSSGGTRQAEGSLVVLEGWAPEKESPRVDSFVEQSPEIVCIKEQPTPQDAPPVKLRNNRFARLYEPLGKLYDTPGYSELDLTPFFAPFYMLFFGFCFGDAGYGLLLFLAAVFVKPKLPAALKPYATLMMYLCGATVVMGLLTGTVFGISLANVPALVAVKDRFLTSDDLFTLALSLGGIQIVFGMCVKAANRIVQFGFMHSLSTFGWIALAVATALAMGYPDLGLENFTMSSPAYLIVIAIAGFAILFLNSPGKNPVVNFGVGLWESYGMITGFIGDLLSYIRLFALGLSGGILAGVFNDLAFGLSPDIPVVKYIVAAIILLIGHSINLFMSALSAFVHPLRLTFVEFYKNAGFEGGGREFRPFKK